MGLYFTWLFGYNYDSNSLRVQGLRSIAEKKKQTPPIGQRTGPRRRSLSSGTRNEKAWEYCEMLHLFYGISPEKDVYSIVSLHSIPRFAR